MPAYKIFISSPGDVGRERHLAEQVIRRVAAEFQNRVEVQPYFWEYEPMESTRDYQENIPLTSAFDLVICILWKRLGSPLSVKHQRPDGGQWRSGTEFELVTAVESKKARGAPDIFIFKNDTKPTFEADEEGEGAKTEREFAQWKALIAFIKEWCEGEQDGQRVFTAALNRYQALDQFEQVLEKLLVGKLSERFPPASDSSDSERQSLRPPPPTWTGSPFRGLEAFQFLHAPVFCGRTHAIGEVLDRLRRKAARGRPFVLILGASGSGKSSLAMAGVVPLLVKPGTIEGVGLWRRVVFRPGGQREVGDLFDRLAAALVRRQEEGEGLPELISGRATVEQLATDLRANPEATALLVKSALNQVSVLHREAEAQRLQRWIAESQAENRTGDVERYRRVLADLKPREARLALVIDQAEELFTSDDLNRRPELRKDFAVALDALAASGFVFVLATLRSDFYAQIQQLPAFVDLKEADGQFDLLPARPAEIAQMIRQPAIAAGLRFEKDPQTQEGLDEVLADQVKAEPRLLPLLEFALDELYKQRTPDGRLTFEAYRVHLDGSIVRALAKRADATLEGLPERSREAFRSVMRRLATTVDDTAAGSATGLQLDVIEKGSSGPTFQRQRVPYDQLTAYPSGAKGLVDAFVAARLLVVEAGKATDQNAEVTVAHEALFVHWAALKNLLLAERDDLILPRARVGASHERWRAENRASDFLLPPGKQLSEAEQLLAEYGEELTPELNAYIAASMAQARAQEKRRQRRLVSALVLFVLLFLGATGAAIFGFWQKDRAVKERRVAVARQLETFARTELDGSGEGLMRSVLLSVESLKSAWTREGHIIWGRGMDLLSHRPQILGTRGKKVVAIAFSRDGHWLASEDEEANVAVWDATTGKPVMPLSQSGQGGQMSFAGLAFSPDGKWLVSGFVREACVWSTEGWKVVKRLPDGAMVWAVAFSPNGDFLATASLGSAQARLYETANWDDVPLPPIEQGASVHALAFSSDSRILLTAGRDIKKWDLTTTPATPAEWLLPDSENFDAWVLAFSADGQCLSAGNDFGLVRVWQHLKEEEKAAGAGDWQTFTWQAHSGRVSGMDFTADGRFLVTAGGDRTARLWEKSFHLIPGWSNNGSPRELTRIVQNVQPVAFSPDGSWLATGNADGTISRWPIITGQEIARLKHGDRVNAVAFSPDGRWLATASDDLIARVFKVGGWSLEVQKNHDAPVSLVTFSPSGRWLITASARIMRAFEAAANWREFQSVTHQDTISGVNFSPDRRWLITISGEVNGNGEVSGKIVRFFDDATLRSIGEVDHGRLVNEIAFSPDGKWIATRSDKVPQGPHNVPPAKPSLIRIWDTEKFREAASDEDRKNSGKKIGASQTHALTAAQKSLLSDSTSWPTVRLRKADAPLELQSADRRWSASTRETLDGIELLEASTDRLANMLRHDDKVTDLALSVDSRWLATASNDHTVRIWALWTNDLIEQACARLTQNLSREERRHYLGDEPYSPTCPKLPVPDK
jgi:WD40 repeat protein